MIFNMIGAGGSSDKVEISITLDDAGAGITVTATDGINTQTATTDASGTVTLEMAWDVVYSISAPGYVTSSFMPVRPTIGLSKPEVFACVIDESVADPNNRVSYPNAISTGLGTYANLASGATPMSGSSTPAFDAGSWGSGRLNEFIEGIKPVAIVRHSATEVEFYDIDRTVMSNWPNTAGTYCCTEFPFRWLSITKSGTLITIAFSMIKDRIDDTFQDYAFLGADGVTRRNCIHIGCFADGEDTVGSETILASRVGKRAAYYRLISHYKVANATGPEFDCISYQQWVYLQSLFVLLYKTTDCQANHSAGIQGLSSEQRYPTTFTFTNNYGMAGNTDMSQSSNYNNAFFWIQNLWGALGQYTASIFLKKGSKRVYVILGAMSRSENWDADTWADSSIQAQMTDKGIDTGFDAVQITNYKKAVGNNLLGFIPETREEGSATTYYPDRAYIYPSSSAAGFAALGGNYNLRYGVGIFGIELGEYALSTSNVQGYGSRISYRGGRP